MRAMNAAPSAPFHRDQQPAALPIWREALVGLDWLALRASPVYRGLGTPGGDGAGVVVVPGFLGTDLYLGELYRWLRRIGYRPYMSRIGRNAECLDILRERLFKTIQEAAQATNRPVHLVGHSLGGMLARSAAARWPHRVASVITLGSPFRGVRSHPAVLYLADRAKRRIQGKSAVEPRCYTGYCGCGALEGLAAGVPASVSQTAMYTRSDGIVDWRYCVTGDPARDVEVPGTHVGLAFNRFVYRAIADRLAFARRPASAPAAG
jgi:pimeloyl-ACP methyl ester carboxylesterase